MSMIVMLQGRSTIIHGGKVKLPVSAVKAYGGREV